METPGHPGLKPGLDTLILAEALEADLRPAFVLQKGHSGPVDGEGWELVFCNRALRVNKSLLDSIEACTAVNQPRDPSEESRQFQCWLSNTRGHETTGHNLSGIPYNGSFWTSAIVRDRFQIISGNHCSHDFERTHIDRGVRKSVFDQNNPETALKMSSAIRDASHPPQIRRDSAEHVARHYDPRPPPSLEDAKVAIPPRLPTSMSSDWTEENPQGTLSPHEVFARNTDWASTPLGPMSSWSSEFREVVNLLMRNPHPAALFWGQELTMVYNDAYRLEVAGSKHPGLMGSGFFGPFAELWESVKPIFEECAQTGKSIRKENDRLLIDRYGYLEETFFSWSWTPLFGGTNSILGFYNAPFETTYQTVSSRRMETLRHLGEQVAPARSVRQFWKGVLAGLEINPYDIPFATLYSITNSDDSDTSSVSSSSTMGPKQCILEGTIAVPDDHPAALQKIDLGSKDGVGPLFRDAIRNNEPVLLRTSEGSLPNFFSDGISFRGFGIPSKEALLIPIRPADAHNTVAFLLVGLNPRRQYDQDYQTFIAMLNRQLKTSLAWVLRLEDEARTNRTAAELAVLQRERLTQELALQTSRLRRMTELSPLGMFLISPDGVLLEGNDRYYEMTNHSRDTAFEMSFMDTVAESCKSTAVDMWYKLTVELKAQSAEIQLSNNYNTEMNEETCAPIDCWVLAYVLPEIGEDGSIRSIMGSITDISHMKWAQSLQDQRLREAEETKRQQNSFIDITSHEMRNPLSAVLICAEDIQDSLTQHNFEANDAEIIASCVDAASTIALCVQHQKAIVDDILTISKLNSNLLVISPVATQPVQIIQQALKMFKNEAQANGINLTLHVHPSLEDLNIHWVMLDPGRLLQITVNLITNAIKFTRDSQQRSISVHVGASLSPPLPTTKAFEYVPTREPCTDVTIGSEWGTDELIYLRVKVADTGCGLTQEEKQRLFERFSQASPRTHAEYGGSGLGLFISRQLAELHGGQIGAASAAGIGSTFGFFIQCKKATNNSTFRTPVPSPTATPNSRPEVYRRKNPSDTQLLVPAHRVSLADSRPVLKEVDSKSLHVLVVEDNLVNQRILKKQLEKVGCVVDTANNGILALQYLKSTELYQSGTRKLSLILMDLEMPEMDGLTCVARIRELQESGVIQRRIPVIAVTANVRAEQVLAARNSGIDDIVSKPFRVVELMAKIESVVGQALPQLVRETTL